MEKLKISQNNLDTEYENNKCDELLNQYNKKCNDLQLKKELIEEDYLKKNPDENNFLYPSLNDPNFIVKIAEKKEFNDTPYDGEIYDLKKHSDKLSNASFELAPHQNFVKNFLSYQTPYNSLLLYHGLGTGKTCSAIGVCEEQREYLNQMSIKRRTIIVASPNVQDSFNMQLFDERKLKKVNNTWNISGCVSNKLLNEINPTNIKGLTREKIITQIKNLIASSYLFMGYIEFANYIERTQQVSGHFKNEEERNLRIIRKLKNEFDGRLIVIDEVHNIRISDEGDSKKVAQKLQALVSVVSNLRLLLLSATPMYNNNTEIVWLLNLMNVNDNRAKISIKDIFDKNGDFKVNKNGEVGKEMLIRKATGYISFVRGENPYIFPYRIFPEQFSIDNTFHKIKYPDFQLNGKKIENNNPTEIVKNQVYLTNIGEYQSIGYAQVLKPLSSELSQKKGINISFDNLDRLGYMILQRPLEALNIVFPLQEDIIDGSNLQLLTGKKGLDNVMSYIDTKSPPEKGSFKYKDWVSDKYGRIFSPENIDKYSSKIKNVCNSIINTSEKVSEGVILVYSQNLDSGLIPMALALEEMGFVRYGNNAKNLFSESPTSPVSSLDMKPIKNKKTPVAKYVMITGDQRLSPDNDFEVKGVTNENNKNGENIKVILISRAGAEGIDFQFIRQIHILDPWYNLSRIEQIIGRGVRSFSHKLLPFEKRNVEIFLYGTILKNKEEEAADLYVYRIASIKAKKIGEVSRVLKETSVDCIINAPQQNYTLENMKEQLDSKVKQVLSNGDIIDDFKVGDKPYTAVCDYMGNCEYKCIPSKDITGEDINNYTYNKSYVMNNLEQVSLKIKDLFKERFFYKKDELIKRITSPKVFPLSQIYGALTQIINDDNELLIDKYGRSGHLINIDNYYLFQPIELNNNNISIFDRSVPIDYKPNKIKITMENTIFNKKEKNVRDKTIDSEKERSQENKEIDEKIDEDNLISSKVFTTIEEKYKTAISQMEANNPVPRGTTDWYLHCGLIMRYIHDEFKIDIKDLEEILVHHLVDMLTYEDKLELIRLIYKEHVFKEESLEYRIKDYLDSQLIKTKRDTMIILYEKENLKVWLFKNNDWILGKPEDERDAIHQFEVNIDKLNRGINKIIGFIDLEIKNNYMVFKVKNMEKKRNKGARCDEALKSVRITNLNMILNDDKFNKENTKMMVQQQLCALQEFMCRYNNIKGVNDKLWFFNYDKSMLLKKELQI